MITDALKLAQDLGVEHANALAQLMTLCDPADEKEAMLVISAYMGGHQNGGPQNG